MLNFSLWTEPWIPVITADGKLENLSIRDTLEQSHRITAIFDPSPLITVSLLRLLLAFVYRIYQPKNIADWTNLWKITEFKPDPIRNYGNKNLDSFNLFHPTRPFYQVTKIPDETIHPIGALIIEAASGNNPTLFDHGRVECLQPDQAARHLVTHQLFAIGGGVSKPFNRMDAPLTKGMVVHAVGQNLFETLLLNLIPLESWTTKPTSEDGPFWEMDDIEDPDKDGTIPLGPLHYLTWQSRQLHLCVDEGSGQVTGVQIRQRYALPKGGFRYDPYKPYIEMDKEGLQPRKGNKQHALWHYTDSLLMKQPKDKKVPPCLSEWICCFKEAVTMKESLPLPKSIEYQMVGMITHPKKAAKIEHWRREQLSIPLEYFGNDTLIDRLEKLLAVTRKFEGLLNRTAHVLAWGLADRKQLPDAMNYFWKGVKTKSSGSYAALGRSYGLSGWFWGAMEDPFRQLILDLPRHPLDEVSDNWLKSLRMQARATFVEVSNSLQIYENTHEVLAHITKAFNLKLNAITLESDEDVREEDDSNEANG